MKTCAICGKGMDDNYNVCPYCGARTDAGEKKDENSQQFDAQQNNSRNQFQNGQQFNQQFQGGNQQQYQRYNYGGQPYGGGSNYNPAPRPQRSAYIAAFLSIFLGVFGVHNFYLNNTTKGIIQLVISVVTFGIGAIAVEIWSIVEAVQLLQGKINVDGEGYPIKMSF